MSKAKQQGTRHESWIVKLFRDHGHAAERLAEGGSSDLGDVRLDLYGEEWIVEGKATATLNIQTTLGKARRKAAGKRPILIWKRLVKTDAKVRQPVEGERVVVILSDKDFLHLLDQAYQAGKNS